MTGTLNLIGTEPIGRSWRSDDALYRGRLLNYPSKRNAAPVTADPANNVLGRPGAFSRPVDVYRDGGFFARIYTILSAHEVRAAYQAGDDGSHWVVLD